MEEKLIDVNSVKAKYPERRSLNVAKDTTPTAFNLELVCSRMEETINKMQKSDNPEKESIIKGLLMGYDILQQGKI